jgi:uncharacterized membrane protein YbhN (UPF0104 family)
VAAVSAVMAQTLTPEAQTRRRWSRWGRAAVGAAIVIALIAVVGAEPFARGLASISPAAIAAATALAAVATAAAAWRWRILARRLGLRLGWRESIDAYYRSQFLNSVLPGGVVGDVNRAVSHGQSVDQVAQASRAVAAERAAGQVVQLVLALGVLVSLGFSSYPPAAALLLVSLGLVVSAVVVAALSSRARLALRRELAILRAAFGTVGAVVGVVAASAVVVAAHVATFLVACAAAGIAASPERMTAAAVVAVLASSIPLSIGGWGPREGAAAWAFAAAGLGAAAGITAATAYGVLATIALAPGAALLAMALLRRRRRASVAAEGSVQP